MRVVIQRVTSARLSIGGNEFSAIGKGIMILVGVENGDTESDAEWLAAKVTGLRVFSDNEGVMNLDIKTVDGDIMAVSQFTLTASTRKGNRPSYIRAAGGDTAKPLYDFFCAKLESLTGKQVARGQFGADMQIELTNDGPVTIIIDSKLRE